MSSDTTTPSAEITIVTCSDCSNLLYPDIMDTANGCPYCRIASEIVEEMHKLEKKRKRVEKIFNSSTKTIYNF